MIKITISRMDDIYECFPDIACAKDGTLVCINRESMMHSAYPFSRLVVRRSTDGGMNWTSRQILLDCVRKPEEIDINRSWLEPDAIAGYEESRSRTKEAWQVGASFNCGRIICLPDGELLIMADVCQCGPDTHSWVNYEFRSNDNGISWSGPERSNLRSGLVPSLTILRNGDLLAQQGVDEDDERAFVCRSHDNGRTWSEPVWLPEKDGYRICEASLVELDDGTIVGFGRNLERERKQLPGLGCKVISRDCGKTWAGPFDARLMGCEGRPKAGLLASGEVCITYRCDMPNELLAMHVMTQAAAASEEMGYLVERMPMPEDIPSNKAKEAGKSRPWYMTSYYPGRTIILDCDRSVHRDSGYSGWVQLPTGDIFVVDYINDDAPLAQIRGYLVTRSDIIFFPDGDLPWLHPSGQPFRGITRAMAEKQAQINAQKQATKQA